MLIRALGDKLDWTAASDLDKLEERLGEQLSAPAGEDTAEA
jgi:hypothetical protein